MDINSIFGDAFGYAKKMFSDLGRLLILIVLNIIPIVDFIVIGYAAKVIRESSTREPPALKDYGDMWIQGLKIVVASIIWMIVPIVLIVLGFGLGALGSFGFAGLGALVILGIIGIALAFIIAIIFSMAIVHMVKQNSFGKAFAVGEILNIIRRIGWGKYILWVIIVFIIGLIIAGIGSIPFVGWLISLIISPVFFVFVARSAILIYIEGVPAPPPTQPQAPAAIPSDAKYCSNCGAILPVDATFCPTCGQKV